jgi:hypothetical protein
MQAKDLKLEPCSECPYPMDVIINPLPKEANCIRFGISCRECGDNWIEKIEEE